ncbi:hypothetical protein, partial [Arsenophonus nasoniae]|uniref:hypothetical protein n=1 Tax=Arsenophonus nasoniae TaxID=638 RepID=UPI00387A556A
QEIRLEITLSEEILTGTKHNKSIPSPFCNKGWLLLLTLKAIQFPNHVLVNWFSSSWTDVF